MTNVELLLALIVFLLWCVVQNTTPPPQPPVYSNPPKRRTPSKWPRRIRGWWPVAVTAIFLPLMVLAEVMK